MGQAYQARPIAMRYKADLYDRYERDKQACSGVRAEKLKTARYQQQQAIDKAKRMARLKRQAIKLISASGMNKKIGYALVRNRLKKDLEQAKINYSKQKKAIYTLTQRRAWADWLRWQASLGDKEALMVLRSRDAKQRLTGNTLSYPHHQPMVSDSPSSIAVDSVTKTGTMIYRAGLAVIRDDGNTFALTQQPSDEAIVTALLLARQRFGLAISVNGSDAFKERVVTLAASKHLPLTFDDADLDHRRQSLITPLKDITDEQQRPIIAQSRRPDRSGDGTSRTIQRGHVSARGDHQPDSVDANRYHKPNLERIGHQPPPSRRNGLRNLSQLGVVQLANRSEMLLPRDVSNHLEQQGTESDNRLRRQVFRSRPSLAADAYIAERELKRKIITTILPHRHYLPSDANQSVQFAGLRNKEGEYLLLLKHHQHIIVMPIDNTISKSLKQVSIGESLTLLSSGVVRIHPRSCSRKR